jgi:hypothetical protein
MKKIDIHIHSNYSRGIKWPAKGKTFATPTQIRRMYDQLGIEKGVLLPIVSPECGYYYVMNEEVYRIATDCPDTFYWFCSIDPRMGGNSSDADLSCLILYYKQLGARGVGEITANLTFDDPLVLNLFKHCEKCDMPLTFHIGFKGDDYGLIDDLGLPKLEKALDKFPNLRFLGHSQKFWSEISPDVTEENRNSFPKGKVKPGGRVIELMHSYPNLSGDLSAGSGGNAVMRDTDFGYWFIEEFQDQLYYGTDLCGPDDIASPMMKLSEWLDEGVRTGRISQTAYEKVCRNNAIKLLHGNE